MPAYGLPLPELLEQGRQAVAASLTPAGPIGVKRALAPLMLTQMMPSTEGMSDNTLQAFLAAKAAEYERHLSEVPLDLLQAAADALAKESPHFPAVADFFRHAKPELEKRRRQASRIAAMIEAHKRPATARKPFTPEPEEVRLLAVLKHYEREGSVLYSPEKARKARERLRELGVACEPAPQPMAEAAQ